jgi:hypothetical protein
MRLRTLVAVTLLLGGCYDGCQAQNSCDDFKPVVDGQPCTVPGKGCYFSSGDYCDCLRDPVRGEVWQCGPRDFSAPLQGPRDLSSPRDLSAVD